MVQNKLYPIAPNPANGVVKVGFTLATGDYITLKVYDINGREVKCILNNQFCLPGMHTDDLDVSKLSAGIYTVAMDNGKGKQVQKLVVSR